jgi:putative oxidoreductase
MYKSGKVEFMSRSYGFFIRLGLKLQHFFLLWMRLTWGHQFMIMGSLKLANFDQTVQSFVALNISHPEFHVYLVSYTEIICGSLIAVGFLSRIASLPLIICMLTALATAHAEKLSHLRFITHPSALVGEAPYPYLLTALMVFCFGPGCLSVDRLIQRWVQRQPEY